MSGHVGLKCDIMLSCTKWVNKSARAPGIFRRSFSVKKPSSADASGRRVPMLKVCSYCGRIHDKKHDCGKRIRYRRQSETDKFHTSYQWTMLARLIKNRDNYLCQACLHNLDKTGVRYTTDNLEVHHIVPVRECWERRKDQGNLITLCREHHEQAEAGKNSRERLTQPKSEI